MLHAKFGPDRESAHVAVLQWLCDACSSLYVASVL